MRLGRQAGARTGGLRDHRKEFLIYLGYDEKQWRGLRTSKLFKITAQTALRKKGYEDRRGMDKGRDRGD